MSRPIAVTGIEKRLREITAQGYPLDISLFIESSPTSLPNRELFALYDYFYPPVPASEATTADAPAENHIDKSIAVINSKLAELPAYRVAHEGKGDLVAHFESYIESSFKLLVKGIRADVAKALATKIKPCNPSWIIPISFEGVDSPTLAANYEIQESGKTTSLPILVKKEWVTRPLETESGFIVGVVNCSTRDVEDRTVSRETLEGASPNDLEVFDAMHEIERLYSNPFGLGIIKVNKSTLAIESDPTSVAAAALRHLDAEKTRLGHDPSSLSLFVIAESYNLEKDEKNSVGDILRTIPFLEFKKRGIKHVALDFVSCNTAEMARELMSRAEEISDTTGLTLDVTFHNGYIFNNITYCYADPALDSRTSAVPKLYDETSKRKKDVLLQVMVPGFSNIYAENTAHLREFADEKRVKGEVASSADDSTPASAGGGSVMKAQKKLINPQAISRIVPGTSFRYSSGARELSVGAAVERAEGAEGAMALGAGRDEAPRGGAGTNPAPVSASQTARGSAAHGAGMV